MGLSGSRYWNRAAGRCDVTRALFLECNSAEVAGKQLLANRSQARELRHFYNVATMQYFHKEIFIWTDGGGVEWDCFAARSFSRRRDNSRNIRRSAAPPATSWFP